MALDSLYTNLQYCVTRTELESPTIEAEFEKAWGSIPDKIPLPKKVAIISMSIDNEAESLLRSMQNTTKSFVYIPSDKGNLYHLLLGHSILAGLSFIFETTCVHRFTPDLFKLLKSQGYTIKIVSIISDAAEGDIGRRILPLKIKDHCVPYVDEISFYGSSPAFAPRLGFKWVTERGVASGEMHHYDTYAFICRIFDNAVNSWGDQYKDYTWKQVVEIYPFSIDFISGAGRP